MPAIRQNCPKLSVSSTSECTFASVAKARGGCGRRLHGVASFRFQCPEPAARGKQRHPESRFQQNPGHSPKGPHWAPWREPFSAPVSARWPRRGRRLLHGPAGSQDAREAGQFGRQGRPHRRSPVRSDRGFGHRPLGALPTGRGLRGLLGRRQKVQQEGDIRAAPVPVSEAWRCSRHPCR